MRVVDRGGREAATRYGLLWSDAVVSALALALETGRTHQIRVHLKHIAHPVFGDPDYGGRAGRGRVVPAEAGARVRRRARRPVAAGAARGYVEFSRIR